MSTTDLHRAEAMLDRAYRTPAQREEIRAVTRQELGDWADIDLEWLAEDVQAIREERARAWNEASARRREREERRAAVKATCALCGYALALLALVAGLAWLIERLPPGLGATLVAAVVVGVLGGGKRC